VGDRRQGSQQQTRKKKCERCIACEGGRYWRIGATAVWEGGREAEGFFSVLAVSILLKKNGKTASQMMEIWRGVIRLGGFGW
jgi:hypothetical protein